MTRKVQWPQRLSVIGIGRVCVLVRARVQLQVLALVLLGAAGVTLTMPAEVGAAAEPRFVDVTGVTGDLDAIWLNPAAAASLESPFVAWECMATGWPRDASPEHGLRHTLALMDTGMLKGGFILLLDPGLGTSPHWSGSYTVAGEWGRWAAGTRFNYQRVSLGEAGARNLWYLDVGATRSLNSVVTMGVAAYRLKLHESWPGLAPPGGRLGFAFALPRPPGLLLTAGIAVEDLRALHEGRLETGVVVPVGEPLRLLGAYRCSWPPSPANGGWMLGATVDWRQLRLQLSYDSTTVYRVGLRLAF